MKHAPVLAALTLAGLALMPAAALADAHAHTDAIGDVRMQTGAMPPGPGEIVPARREGDIRALRVNHLPQRVLVTLTFRELSPKIDGVSYQHRFEFRFRTAALTRDVVFIPGMVEGGQLVIRNGAGKVVSCRANARADYPANVVTLDLARTCLNSPAWVRVGAKNTSIALDDSGADYRDDANATSVYATPVLGPRVRS